MADENIKFKNRIVKLKEKKIKVIDGNGRITLTPDFINSINCVKGTVVTVSYYDHGIIKIKRLEEEE